jgi:ribonucleotide reductase beta subunit family protein with ferritin-like domain
MNTILLNESKDRYTMFPIKDDGIWKLYKKSVAVFWTAEEINLAGDYEDFATLTPNEQHFIKMILAFFASSDGVVLENLGTRFLNEVQLSEARAFYSFQLFMETVHGETYSLLIDTYVKDKKEKATLFNAIETFPCVKKKADWAIKWIEDKDSSFETRLLAFACVEGIFFSGAFCSIFWLKKRGLMKGLGFSNELISRDEGLHTEFAVYLYNTYGNRLPEDTVSNLIHEAVTIEKEFICYALPCRLIGMNSVLMGEYIEYVADRLLVQLGYKKYYNTNNPFQFMEQISMDAKTNFFEKRNSDYSLAHGGDREKAFAFDENAF